MADMNLGEAVLRCLLDLGSISFSQEDFDFIPIESEHIRLDSCTMLRHAKANPTSKVTKKNAKVVIRDWIKVAYITCYVTPHSSLAVFSKPVTCGQFHFAIKGEMMSCSLQLLAHFLSLKCHLSTIFISSSV